MLGHELREHQSVCVLGGGYYGRTRPCNNQDVLYASALRWPRSVRTWAYEKLSMQDLGIYKDWGTEY